MSFTDLAVPADLVSALARQHISVPTEIQAAAFPVLRAGSDAYLRAKTGTGKTLAYLIPFFEAIDAQLPATQAIIVAPTHELAIQIQRQCVELAQNAGRALRTLLLIGGTVLDRQLDKLKKKPQLVVGSPGRIRELIAMGKLKSQHVKFIAIDEADRLLSRDSLPEIEAIIAAAPRTRQLVFISATQAPESVPVLAKLAPALVMVQAGRVAVSPTIDHYYMLCEEREKPETIRKFFHALEPERAIVFFHRNQSAAQVTAMLQEQGIPVADLGATLNKMDRKQAMDDIRSGAVRVLLATDVAARGLDIKGVTHIFNLDVPTLSQDYLHRVGRTGRAGAPGIAISLLAPGDIRRLRRYEEELGITFLQVRVRDGHVSLVEPGPRPA